MHIEISARDIDLAPPLRDQTERRLRLALGRFTTRIARVVVQLEDLSRRKGPAHQCRIVATLIPSGRIVVSATEADMEAAVGRAADRITRRVRAKFDSKGIGRSHAAEHLPPWLGRGI